MALSKGKNEFSGKDSRLNLILSVVALLVCSAIPFVTILGSQHSFGRVSDFPEYYGAARLICSGHGAEIYNLSELFRIQHAYFPSMGGRGIGFYIPPFSAVFLSPLGFFSPAPSYWIFTAILFSAVLLGAFVLGRYFKLKASGIAWMLAFLFATAPVFESLKISQLAPVLFAAIALFLVCIRKNNHLVAGLCLAPLLLKPQELLPLAVYMFFAGRLKAILVLSGVFVALVALSLLLISPAGYGNYLDLLKDSATNTQFMQPELSATVRGQLLRIGALGTGLANLLSAFSLAGVLSIIAFAGFKPGRGLRFEKGLLKLALPLGLLSALHCHDYDLILLVPWAVELFLGEEKSFLASASKVALLLLIVAFLLPIYVPIHYDWLIKSRQAVNPIFVLLLISSSLSAASFLSASSGSLSSGRGDAMRRPSRGSSLPAGHEDADPPA